MTEEPEFDVVAAHKYFSAECFNRTWGFIEKADRTPEDDEQMLLLTFASQWHWSQREDCASTNVSVGYWQISRVYSLLGQAENARKYGQLSLDALKGETGLPFYFGYAYEALARAEMVAGEIKPATTQIPTPEIAPKTVDTRIRTSDDRRASSRSSGSSRFTASVSVTTINRPPPIAKCETMTCGIATRAISIPPPIARSQIG